MRSVSMSDLRANSDLLFCPFCGGEAHIKEVVSACSVVYTVGCPDSGCMGFETLLCKPTPEEAVAAWNRRSERTCRDECEAPQSFLCGECGWFDTDFDGLPLEYSFCPNCGARVVEGDL